MIKWSNKDIEILRNGVDKGKSHADIAVEIGKTTAAVRHKASKICSVNKIFWSESEIKELNDIYSKAGIGGVVCLDEFSKKIGKNKSNVCRKAKQMGLPVSGSRKKVENRKERRKFGGDIDALKSYRSAITTKRIKEKGHPRGALGMKHTQETKTLMAQKSRDIAASMTIEQKAERTLKAMQTRVKNGTAVRNSPHGSWKAGWHEIGGKRKYYRSNWEANYARYLEWLKGLGKIKEWSHEPKTFWFEGIKRGCVSYLPDFCVTENDGKEAYHEVKGWMDDRSRVKIERMGRYHPSVTLIVVDAKAYQEIRKKLSSIIPGWHDIQRDKRGV